MKKSYKGQDLRGADFSGQCLVGVSFREVI